MIKQTGLLFKFSDKDFIAGANSPLTSSEVMPSGDWRTFLPSDEKQYKDFTFDTMSCTTFSALNIIETWINFLMKDLPQTHKDWLNANGYVENGKVNFSDRFTAIMSDTMPQGNYFQKVLDSVRKDGLLPEKDLPFGGNSWAEYHDKTKITVNMKEKAKKFTELFTVSYEWTPVGNELFNDLKHSPLQVAIPATATHAVMLPKLDFIYDTYPPFLYQRNTLLAYAMRIFVKPVKPEPVVVTTYRYFKGYELYKMTKDFMDFADELRHRLGFPLAEVSGFRTPEQNKKVGGVFNSPHLDGKAKDWRIPDGARKYKFVEEAQKLAKERNVIIGIGVNDTTCHLDVGHRQVNTVWNYK